MNGENQAEGGPRAEQSHGSGDSRPGQPPSPDDTATSPDRETLRTAANVVGVLLLIGVVAPFVVYGVPQVVGADQGFVVLSGSMEPAMSPGDAVIVRDAGPGEITEGDVITYRAGGDTPTTHRVVDVVERDGGAAYVTKGDANENPDAGSVPHGQVIGEVVFVLPLIGHVVWFANTPLGFAALVAAPIALFVLSELRTLVGSVHEGSPADSVNDGTVSASDVDGVGRGDDGDGSSITLTRSSLQLLALVFGLYLPYSAYVAYTTVAAWSVAAAVATVIGFLFAVGLYVGTGWDGSVDGDGDAVGNGLSDDRAAADGGTEVVADPDSDEMSDPDATVRSRSVAAQGERTRSGGGPGA